MNLWQSVGKRILLFDGGLGTLLQSKGLGPGESPVMWTLTHPEQVLQVHTDYLLAGCDFVTTNTFGANRLLLAEGVGVSALVETAVALAKSAVASVGHGLVALDIGPSGRLLEPYGDLPFEEAVSVFGEVIEAGAKAGADLVMIETMTDSYELKAAVIAAKEVSNLPVMATMMFDEKGKLLTGADVRGMVAMLEGLGVAALGCNCGFGPSQIKSIAAQLLCEASIPVIVNPNAGLPEIVDGKTRFNLSPEAFAQEMVEIAQMGAWFVGGCCGTTPDHIRVLKQACAGIQPKPIKQKTTCVVSSWGCSVSMDDGVCIIGERINPTGKKKLKQALKNHDVDFVLREALRQQAEGAEILDFNVGLPELNEEALFAELLPRVQAVTDLPIQIDTSNIQAMERAMRLYNGKPLINSVCAKQESMDAVFPLVKRYGGAVIALTLDENGIPNTAEERVALAVKICKEAEKYGISTRNILVDVLTLPIAAQENAAEVTLEALRNVRQLGLRTVLGVSNISFGLPSRHTLNAAFLTMAVEAGLNAAIMNPGAAEMMQALHAACALSRKDAHFSRYLAYQSAHDAPEPAKSSDAGPNLQQAVASGLAQDAAQAAKALLNTQSPEEIIEQILMPTLDEIGKRYEKGTLYLPQLLQSTDAAKAAFDALSVSKARLSPAARVALATVYGDVHDIGKNIVKVLLENYGYDVIDLGKNVPHQSIVDAVAEQGIKLVGLSALMTTTVPSMQEAIRLLRARVPDVFIMVGGAVLSEDLAAKIGADAYGADAMAAVSIAKTVLGEAR